MTEQQKTNLAARKLKERLLFTQNMDLITDAIRRSPYLICIVDTKKKKFMLVNEAWTDETGYSFDELTAESYEGFIHPDDLKRTIIFRDSELPGNSRHQWFYNRYKKKTGGYVWQKWFIAPEDPVLNEIMFAFSEVVRNPTQNKHIQKILGSN